MLIEIDDSYVQWVKKANPESFAPGTEEKEVLAQYISEVLGKHRESWLVEEQFVLWNSHLPGKLDRI